nr:MAG TPA: hypothetical protein [Caudoviricetes sp.]
MSHLFCKNFFLMLNIQKKIIDKKQKSCYTIFVP